MPKTIWSYRNRFQCRLGAGFVPVRSAVETNQKKRSRSKRALANPVAWWIVGANPNFATTTSSDGAANLFGGMPNDLRVVAAHARTTVVRVVIVVPSLISPFFDYL